MIIKYNRTAVFTITRRQGNRKWVATYSVFSYCSSCHLSKANYIRLALYFRIRYRSHTNPSIGYTNAQPLPIHFHGNKRSRHYRRKAIILNECYVVGCRWKRFTVPFEIGNNHPQRYVRRWWWCGKLLADAFLSPLHAHPVGGGAGAFTLRRGEAGMGKGGSEVVGWYVDMVLWWIILQTHITAPHTFILVSFPCTGRGGGRANSKSTTTEAGKHDQSSSGTIHDAQSTLRMK